MGRKAKVEGAGENEFFDLKDIISNNANPRDSVPSLAAMGYGVFKTPEGSAYKPLMTLALSDDPADRKEFVTLIEEYEGGKAPDGVHQNVAARNQKQDIRGLAFDIAANGMINPVTLIKIDGGYDLETGCRRVLAAAYNFCKSGGKLGARVLGRIVKSNENEAQQRARSENFWRLDMNPIEEAKAFASMRHAGDSNKEIAEKTGVHYQTVRNRQLLLQLKPEEQEKVAIGQLLPTAAVKLVESRKKGNQPAVPTGSGHRGDGTRRSAPTIKDWKEMYETRDDIHEKVREFIALELLVVEYETMPQLRKRLEAEEKAKQKEKKDKEAAKAAKEKEKETAAAS